MTRTRCMFGYVKYYINIFIGNMIPRNRFSIDFTLSWLKAVHSFLNVFDSGDGFRLKKAFSFKGNIELARKRRVAPPASIFIQKNTKYIRMSNVKAYLYDCLFHNTDQHRQLVPLLSFEGIVKLTCHSSHVSNAEWVDFHSTLTHSLYRKNIYMHVIIGWMFWCFLILYVMLMRKVANEKFLGMNLGGGRLFVACEIFPIRCLSLISICV